ncbi:hypothetical protein HL658_29210 [Azospirillum sp. RWY-5-1]|uniref:Uncharacterized protein n=1 Tax=Azospirillum oleiclasticum TaxID=2735135 RepID=A0ABX2TIF8_9PROT|nr:hypothetical protein [Azospirillum oleiclasticum]NYZ16644.1 hypothetical protein [Azospirillum oleiclasticum]NYZ24131.1 hypothetical protein [Azospirillum oleiclasticum]
MFVDLLPKTEDELHQASLIICAVYIATAYVMWLLMWMAKKRSHPPINYIGKIFDAVTFSTSMFALASIFDKNVLVLMGNLKPFLILAGLCGGIYSLHALFKA